MRKVYQSRKIKPNTFHQKNAPASLGTNLNARQLSNYLSRECELDVGDPWHYLAIGIVCQAIIDLKKMGEEDSFHASGAKGYTVYRNEIESFFRSGWFGTLIECQEYTAGEFLDLVGIKEK